MTSQVTWITAIMIVGLAAGIVLLFWIGAALRRVLVAQAAGLERAGQDALDDD